jgi:hypothetical protein
MARPAAQQVDAAAVRPRVGVVQLQLGTLRDAATADDLDLVLWYFSSANQP